FSLGLLRVHGVHDDFKGFLDTALGIEDLPDFTVGAAAEAFLDHEMICDNLARADAKKRGSNLDRRRSGSRARHRGTILLLQELFELGELAGKAVFVTGERNA